MRILEIELEAQYQLTKLLISTGYMEQNIEVLEDALRREDDLFNQGNNVFGLDVVRRIVNDATDVNMDEFNSDEDESPVKDEVSRR